MKYPVYVISKGRAKSNLTARALLSMGVPFRLVVEPQEFDDYAKAIDPSMIAPLPFSNLGLGSIPARNWCWEDSLSRGDERHWILDDNIRKFFRLNQNRYYTFKGDQGFSAIEEWSDRYENVAQSGMQYFMFTPRRAHRPAVSFNTRIYSCILINNALPFRWRGRYNEDTDLSLRCLKAGWCTALFNIFLCDKVTTMQMTGGNTDELYKGDGRLMMAQSLKKQHPDITRIAWRWGRWQHVVDYRQFRRNRLKLKPDVEIPTEPNEFGMRFPTGGPPF